MFIFQGLWDDIHTAILESCIEVIEIAEVTEIAERYEAQKII